MGNDLAFAQIIGLLASAAIITAFGMKCDRRFKFVIFAGHMLFALHFFLIGAYAGSVTNLINGGRTIFSIKFHQSTRIMIFFIGLYTLSAILMVREPIDFLPFFTGIIGTYAVYKLSGIPMRLILLLSSFMWLVYNTVFSSYGGIITELFASSINLITMYRIFCDLKKVKENEA